MSNLRTFHTFHTSKVTRLRTRPHTHTRVHTRAAARPHLLTRYGRYGSKEEGGTLA